MLGRRQEDLTPLPWLLLTQCHTHTATQTDATWYNLGTDEGLATKNTLPQASQRSLGFQASPALPSFFKGLLKEVMHFTWISALCYLAKDAHLKSEWLERLVYLINPPPPTYLTSYEIRILTAWGEGKLHTEILEKPWILLGRRKSESWTV